jgi:aryl-alcohol dehydrogenase-like predicted oxidoreductase
LILSNDHQGDEMNTRNLGKSGLQVSLLGLGCNNFGWTIDFDSTRKVIHKALDLGITLFDTADHYGKRGGSETYIGQVLGDRRKDIVLATKYGMAMDKEETLKGASRRYTMSAVEASLKRLKTDWIDLYQLHQYDATTPIEETLRALDDLIRQGKVRYIGCSNAPAWRVVEAQWTAKQLGVNALISCQDPYSLLTRHVEDDLIPAMQADGSIPQDTRLAKIPFLADCYLADSQVAKLKGLDAFCAARGRSMAELAFSWLASRPTVSSIIAGATKPEQLESNMKCLDWKLSPEDLAEVDRITAGPSAKLFVPKIRPDME